MNIWNCEKQFRSEVKRDSAIYDVCLCSLSSWQCLNKFRVAMEINLNFKIRFALFFDSLKHNPILHYPIKHWNEIFHVSKRQMIFQWKFPQSAGLCRLMIQSFQLEGTFLITKYLFSTAFHKIDSLTFYGFFSFERIFFDFEKFNTQTYQNINHIYVSWSQTIKWWFQHLAHPWWWNFFYESNMNVIYVKASVLLHALV